MRVHRRRGDVAAAMSFAFLAQFCWSAQAAIDIDGRLNEPGWADAHVMEGFIHTAPFTREPAPYPVRVLVLPAESGLHVGATIGMPPEQRTRGRSPRDAEGFRNENADAFTLLVDFEGAGRAAYEFTVTLSGSIRDGAIARQNQFSYDWDAVWYHAVREDDAHWTVEMMLPWSTAPMQAPVDGERTIGVHASVFVRAFYQRYAFPAVLQDSPSLVADFHRLRIPAHDSAFVAWIPYASLSHDLIRDDLEARAGVDLIWKPDAAQQLTATLNPDFGQVESDDLVVNFTAIETFFSDKRPFFTQNQQLFDLKTTADGVLVNTRRIGAAPDAGAEGSTDILGAAKYTYAGQRWEFGAFGAVEDDAGEAQGRDYAAVRLRRTSGGERWRFGYLGTHVNRPELDRRAVVHAADLSWVPGGGWAVAAQAITTRPTGTGESGLATNPGYGGWAEAAYSSQGALKQTVRLSAYDRDYDINDLGFMTRNSLRELQSETYWYLRNYAETSRVTESYWFFDARLRENADGDPLMSSVEIGHFWQYRDSSSLYIYASPHTSGYDDLSTRGNGTFQIPAQHEARLSFLGPTTGKFRYFFWLKATQEGLDDWAREILVQPFWLPVETFKLSIETIYRDSPDWLIWRPDAGRMTRHTRELLQTSVSADWYPSIRSEVRLRLQWAGVRAHALQSYDIDADRWLTPAAETASDFSFSDLAVQLRLRYQLKPLSDVFVVYGYGGTALLDESTGFGSLWREAIDQEQAHQVMVKVSYRI